MNEATINNHYSWHRVRMLARFYYPAVRLPLMLYPAVSLVLGMLNHWLNQSEIGMYFASFLSLILSMMFYFFPLFFTRTSSPVVESMLPATSGERLTVFTIACLIINPILTYLPYYTVGWILGTTSELLKQINTLNAEFMAKSYGLVAAQSLPPLVTCMFVVFTRWKNRISTAIGFTILTLVALTIAGAIFGIIIAATTLESDLAMVDPGGTYNDGFQVGMKVAEIAFPVVICIGILSIIYTALMIGLTYRKLRRQQI